jgi:hypothetical protein
MKVYVAITATVFVGFTAIYTMTVSSLGVLLTSVA